VLTNDHVAGKASSIKVILNDEREYDAKLVGTDERKDVALIKFETSAQDISIATLGDSSKLHVGDWAIAVGSPLGLVSSVTTGIVSALGRTGGPDGNISDFIQTDASINRGNSGGALVNIYGEVVGINTWIASPTGGSIGLGFAIPINNIKGAIDDFIRHGQVKYGWLGVSLLGRDADKASARELGIEGRKGAFVSQVFRKGPADKAGILPGDFIVSADGAAVKGQDNLVRIIGDIEAGRTTELTIVRGGKTVTLSAKIEERDKAVASNDGNLYPGLDVVSLKSEMIDAQKLPKEAKNGVAVINVTAKSPSATIGVKPGDIITAVNETKIDNLAEFYSALNDREARKISFTILRDGQEVTTLAYVKK
jgi:Do/DeqQ family serine protease